MIIENNENRLNDEFQKSLNNELGRYENIKICDTPAICMAIGMNSFPMLYTQTHFKKAIEEKNNKKHTHGLAISDLMNIPDEIRDPVMIFDSLSDDKSIIIVTSLLDKDNAPIITVIEPDGKGFYKMEQIDTNMILSIYGKDNNFSDYISRAIANNKVLFCNKNKTERLFSLLQLQLPKGFNNLSFDNIIHQSNNIVNIKLSEIKNIFYKIIDNVITKDEEEEKKIYGEVIINFTNEDKNILVDRVINDLNIKEPNDFYKLLAEKATFLTDIINEQTNKMLDEKDTEIEKNNVY